MKKIRAILIVFTIACIFSGCKEKTLSLSAFGDVTSEHSIRVFDYDTTDSRIKRWSRARSDANDIVIQFIECSSESDANSVYSENVTYMKNSCETSTETGSEGNGRYKLSAQGFYYEVDRCNQYVVVVTCSTVNRAEAQQIISELPEVGSK